MKRSVEVEIRSLISKKQFDYLMNFFKQNADFIKKDNQKTHYFDTKQDLRIQLNNYNAKIWLKKGKLHDEAREEIEIKFDRNDFAKLEQLFLALGCKVKIKWFRRRQQFNWNGVNVSLDYTKGYGHIIELEKICMENEKDSALAALKEKMDELKIKLTPRHEFEKKFKYYEKNWQKMTKT